MNSLDQLAGAALLLVRPGMLVIGTPMLVLMPLFWLDTKLPAEAGLNRLLAPIMALVLISLVLVVLVNAAGAAVATGLAVANRPRAAQRS